jgi:hypothetical protein
VKVSDIFTACYSTILATAAVADAKVKEDRRRDWDRAIAEAKSTTPWPGSETSRCADDASESRMGSNNETLDQPVSGPRIDIPAWNNEAYGSSTANFETRLRVLHEEIGHLSGQPDDLETEDLVTDQQLVQAAEAEWIDEEPDHILPERDPKRPIHLERRELSCASLVEQLLQKLVGSVQTRVEGVSLHEAHPELKDIVLQIQTLRSGFTKLPTYVWEDLSLIEQERRALHRSLLDVCNEAEPNDKSSLELMLAKICYNLLVCSTPISMVTYNILIGELGRLHQYDLAQVIVDSFLHETRLLPNHNSLRIILEHYHGKNDPEGWRAIKNRMRATRGDMRIKRRYKNDLDLHSVQEWIEENFKDLRYIRETGLMVQKPPRDFNVFDSLIRTSLKFNGPRNAIMHIGRALREGQRLYSDTLCAVMEELVRRKDERGSTSLLLKILSLWDADADVDANVIVFTEAVRGMIYQLLSMIGIEASLGSTSTPPHHLPLDRIQAMLRQLRIFSIEDSISRSEDFVSTIEDHLEDFHYSQMASPKSTQVFEPSMTSDLAETDPDSRKHLDSLDWFSDQERNRWKEREHNIAKARWARIEVLEKNLEYQALKVAALECQALPFAFKALPRYQQLRYLDITSSNMVYCNKSQRPSQYVELLRVRREGPWGLLSYVEKQLQFNQKFVHESEAKIFSMEIALGKLSHLDIIYYLDNAASRLVASEKYAEDLAIKISEVRQVTTASEFCAEQSLDRGIKVDGPNVVTDPIATQQLTISSLQSTSKEVLRLEREADRVHTYIGNLQQMWRNLVLKLRTTLVERLANQIKLSAQILANSEDQVWQLSSQSLRLKYPRVTRTVDMPVEIAMLVRQLGRQEYQINMIRQQVKTINLARNKLTPSLRDNKKIKDPLIFKAGENRNELESRVHGTPLQRDTRASHELQILQTSEQMVHDNEKRILVLTAQVNKFMRQISARETKLRASQRKAKRERKAAKELDARLYNMRLQARSTPTKGVGLLWVRPILFPEPFGTTNIQEDEIHDCSF